MNTEDQAKQLRDIKRMELFNAVYLSTEPIHNYLGDHRKEMATKALDAFDQQFKEKKGSDTSKI